MPTMDDYVNNLQRALIDAATDQTFKTFIEPADLELVVVDAGDGTQMQVQALSGRSVRKVVEKILARANKAGVDMKRWICSADEFDLCAKLRTPAGDLMRQLNQFLKSKSAQGGITVAGLIAAFGTFASAAVLGSFLAVFVAVGFVNDVFVELCDCPKTA